MAISLNIKIYLNNIAGIAIIEMVKRACQISSLIDRYRNEINELNSICSIVEKCLQNATLNPLMSLLVLTKLYGLKGQMNQNLDIRSLASRK